MMNPAESTSPVDAAPARPSDSCVMVIFGASGDLTKRKLIPALYNLALYNLLSRQFAVIGFAGTDYNTERFREQLQQDLREFSSRPIDEEIWERLARRIFQFKRAPFMLFRRSGADSPTQNRLVIRIQPDEGIALTFGAKSPGTVMRQSEVHMDFSYAEHFGEAPSTGYERLLYDCMIGDQTLFQRADMVEAGWALIQPILDVWGALPARDFPNYAAGTWGPSEPNELLTRDGRAWGKMPP